MTRTIRVSLAIGFAWGAAGATGIRAGLLESIPADVLARWDLARENMRKLAIGMAMYANDNNGKYPTDLRKLYPKYVASAAYVWHPGDSDPVPASIDTNDPNQPNSTRISFEFTAARSERELCEADPLVWDNSAANNGGYFINKVTRSAVVETDPPFITPTPTRPQVARGNLLLLHSALMAYAMDNDDEFPNDPLELWAQGILCSPKTFWNPGDSNAQPTPITNSVPNATNSAQISFEFLTSGHSLYDFAMNDVLIRDNSPANNGGYGINVVRYNRRVEFLALPDIDADRDVDLADFTTFQACFNGPNRPAALPGCASVDFDQDTDVDLVDFKVFQTCFNGPNRPPACG